jgi:dynein heavy chain
MRSNSPTCTIEGDTVDLDATCGVFITMNPVYLGRSTLPEGLKALFRPITVMVPDLILICENMLMAEGFTEAKLLARKFYGLYSLLKDLLSPQAHYDWGLRAVKSVLVVAGMFKRAESNVPEEHVSCFSPRVLPMILFLPGDYSFIVVVLGMLLVYYGGPVVHMVHMVHVD